MGLPKQSYQSAEISAADPSAVFLVKSLLNPVIAVGSLVVCLLSWDEPLYGPYFLIAVLTFVGTADFLDSAQIQRAKGTLSALQLLLDIAVRWALLIGFLWILLHLSGLTSNFNHDVLRTWAVVTPAALWIGQAACQRLLVTAGSRGTGPRHAVIVGLTEVGLRLERSIRENPLLRTKVVGYLEDRSAARVDPQHVGRILGSCNDLPTLIALHNVQVVYITLPMNRDPRVLKLLDALRDSTCSIYFVPDLFTFNLIQARFDLIDGVPLVAVCESPFYGIRGIAKRLCDIVVAGTALLLIAPLLLGVAVAIRLDSPGAAIFRQKRYGLDGKEITVYKFRSMTVTEDGKTAFTAAARGDRRITTLGAFIRKTSIDELPQLFNVLEGSMSIVGPRPHPIAMNEQYRRLIPSYMVRHKVKPGITGWAQVNGYRGGDDLESMRKRIEFDLEYLRHWSLWLDLSILLKTTTLVWNDKQAY
jgi:putative colanic acid biosynthesis UDP-glucose lipid carrier transferase